MINQSKLYQESTVRHFTIQCEHPGLELGSFLSRTPSDLLLTSIQEQYLRFYMHLCQLDVYCFHTSFVLFHNWLQLQHPKYKNITQYKSSESFHKYHSNVLFLHAKLVTELKYYLNNIRKTCMWLKISWVAYLWKIKHTSDFFTRPAVHFSGSEIRVLYETYFIVPNYKYNQNQQKHTAHRR